MNKTNSIDDLSRISNQTNENRPSKDINDSQKQFKGMNERVSSNNHRDQDDHGKASETDHGSEVNVENSFGNTEEYRIHVKNVQTLRAIQRDLDELGLLFDGSQSLRKIPTLSPLPEFEAAKKILTPGQDMKTLRKQYAVLKEVIMHI